MDSCQAGRRGFKNGQSYVLRGGILNGVYSPIDFKNFPWIGQNYKN